MYYIVNRYCFISCTLLSLAKCGINLNYSPPLFSLFLNSIFISCGCVHYIIVSNPPKGF